MIIITSGDYLSVDFQIEFGKIPPCMLPIGNKKLVEHQVRSLRKHFKDQRIILTLPDDFEPSFNERSLIEKLEIECIRTPAGESLSDSLLYVVNSQATYNETVRLLHGDTLINAFPTGDDVIGVAETQDHYAWEMESLDDFSECVWCGYFSFANVRSLVRVLALSKGNFISAVRKYAEQHSVEVLKIRDWYDLGHVNTYFKTRSSLTTQRAFNSLSIVDGVVLKTGKPYKKIVAEGEWYKNIPIRLKRYVPQFFDSGIQEDGAPFYTLEYLPFSPLNEIYVHGHNPPYFWKRIFDLVRDFMLLAKETAGSDVAIEGIASEARALYCEKTDKRLQAFSLSSGISLDKSIFYKDKKLPCILQISKVCQKLTLDLPVVPSVLHGDLCLSNILFDARSVALKVIDPRGLTQNNVLTIYGDQKYDLAKLTHSIIGLYDFIIAGRYRLSGNGKDNFAIDFDLDKRCLAIQKIFKDTVFIEGVIINDLVPLTVLLFLSMLPLHADKPDRQLALLSNAIRLYSENIHQG